MSWDTSSDLTNTSSFMRKTSDVPNERHSMRGLVKRTKAKKNSSLNDRLVFGIDFGTTFSGVAWATVDDLEDSEINIITSWPKYRREDGKAPTELFYEDDEVMWGYEIPSDADPVLWFKLLLLRDEDIDEDLRQSDYYIRAKRKLKELDKGPTDLIADYLRALWQHTLHTIRKSRSRAVIAALMFHVVITVPAIWKDYARTRMREAVAKAGILDHRSAGPTTLSFVPEPEAAGLITLLELGRRLEADDVYVICDAGGGTVDLISYRIGNLDPIELHEAVAGTGGLCGGIFVDEQFERLCKKRLGRSWNNLSQASIKGIIKSEWEYVYKPSYTGRDRGREFPIGIPAEALGGSNKNDLQRKPHIKDGRIHFSNSDIRSAFTTAFSSIDRLVDSQIKNTQKKSLLVKGIVLVGGFGASPYLYNHLKDRFAKQGIEVLQDTGLRPRTAICRGAILKGFLDAPSTALAASAHVNVASTIARQNLGLQYRPPFDKTIHNKRDRIIDEDEGVWRVKEMKWYLRKGGSVLIQTPIRHSFYRTYATEEKFNEDRGTMVTNFYQCDDDVAPLKRSESMHLQCKLHWHYVHNITYESLPEFRAKNGKVLKKLDYEIVMIPSGASTEFTIYYDKKKVDSRDIRVEFQ